MLKRLIIIILFSGAFVLSKGQHHHIYGIFPTYNQNGNITKGFDYSIYSFLAIYPLEQSIDETVYPAKSNAFYIELDGIYKLNKKWFIAGSYTYERVNPFRSDYRNENRIWPQIQYYENLGFLNLKNRLRYDFRFIENRLNDQTDFRPRLRYLIGIDFSIKDETSYFASYNEFFFDTFEERIALYSENWAFAGIGFKLQEQLKLETGPLLISWIRNTQKDWLHQYFWQLTLISQLDLTTKK